MYFPPSTETIGVSTPNGLSFGVETDGIVILSKVLVSLSFEQEINTITTNRKYKLFMELTIYFLLLTALTIAGVTSFLELPQVL